MIKRKRINYIYYCGTFYRHLKSDKLTLMANIARRNYLMLKSFLLRSTAAINKKCRTIITDVIVEFFYLIKTYLFKKMKLKKKMARN